MTASLPLALDNVGLAIGGRTLLDGISFTLGGGARSIVLGPNGAGKSLLLRLCHALMTPTAGSIRFGAATPAAARARQAMVFQRPVLLRRSAAANVAYGLALRGVARRERRRIVAAVLEATGLAALADRPARVLSGGEQQRLALARAWALRPEVLFLDEPTAALDPAAVVAVEAIVAAMHRDGTKIVMTTHDLAQARRLADEVLFLHRGRLLEQGPADRFFAAPQTEAAAAFIAGRLTW
ncbi:MAG: ATP-binding cassette domain-containing protein [Rhodospirillales bacterium]